MLALASSTVTIDSQTPPTDEAQQKLIQQGIKNGLEWGLAIAKMTFRARTEEVFQKCTWVIRVKMMGKMLATKKNKDVAQQWEIQGWQQKPWRQEIQSSLYNYKVASYEQN